MARHLLAAVVLLVLGACTAPSTKMIDDRTAIVNGRVDMVDGRGTMTTAMLREAARQCLDRGFTYFQVVSNVDQSGTMGSGAPTTSTGTADTAPAAAPPPTVSFSKAPRGDIMVRFYKPGEINPGAPDVWNAQALVGKRS